MYQQMIVKLRNIKFNKQNTFSDSRVVTCGQTEIRWEGGSFCALIENFLK